MQTWQNFRNWKIFWQLKFFLSKFRCVKFDLVDGHTAGAADWVGICLPSFQQKYLHTARPVFRTFFGPCTLSHLKAFISCYLKTRGLQFHFLPHSTSSWKKKTFYYLQRTLLNFIQIGLYNRNQTHISKSWNNSLFTIYEQSPESQQNWLEQGLYWVNWGLRLTSTSVKASLMTIN